MGEERGRHGVVLLIDTCGSEGSLALAREGEIIAGRTLAARGASAQLLGEVREMLGGVGLEVKDLGAVGVVSGPGSFTGVRVGLAVAKGLCEALGVRLAAVSRLAVLAHAAQVGDGFAVLEAGRGEVFVRREAEEMLLSVDDVIAGARGSRVVTADEPLAEKLAGLQPEVRRVQAKDALPLVEQMLASGGSDVGLTDANYVRGEDRLYAKAATAAAE